MGRGVGIITPEEEYMFTRARQCGVDFSREIFHLQNTMREHIISFEEIKEREKQKRLNRSKHENYRKAKKNRVKNKLARKARHRNRK